jgi:hypothetical protein
MGHSPILVNPGYAECRSDRNANTRDLEERALVSAKPVDAAYDLVATLSGSASRKSTRPELITGSLSRLLVVRTDENVLQFVTLIGSRHVSQRHKRDRSTFAPDPPDVPTKAAAAEDCITETSHRHTGRMVAKRP